MKIFNKVAVLTVLVFSLGFGFTSPTALLADDNLTPVNLGAAGNFVILAKTGISTTGATSIVGDIGVSPAAATYITGFAFLPTLPSAFSISTAVNGKIYAPGYADPTTANLTKAVLDMQTAYTDAAGRASNVTELGAGNIGGLTLAPGVYKWGTGVTIPTDVTLSGSANDVWIFQIAQNLSVSSGAKIILSGGAQIGNIFWVVGGQTTLGTTSVFNGNILDQTAIVLNTGAILNGRALAQTAVTLDANSVTVAPVVVVVPIPLADENGVPANSSSNSNGSANNNNGSTTSSTTNNTNSATSAIPATQIEGCVSGNLFSATSGKSCTVSATPAVPASAVIAGCEGRATGFSRSSGQSCVGNSITSTTSYNFGTTTLKNGSSGSAVMELQKFLNAKLSLGLVVDGKLGPKTIAVIKKWQKDNGLVADGLIGVKTKVKMNASIQ